MIYWDEKSQFQNCEKSDKMHLWTVNAITYDLNEGIRKLLHKNKIKVNQERKQ